MRRSYKMIFFLIVFLPVISWNRPHHTVWLDELDLEMLSENIRPVKARVNYLGRPIQMDGKTYSRGIGVITFSVIPVVLNGNAKSFTAVVGPDDAGNKDLPLKFYVIGDQKILFESGDMYVGDASQIVNINLKGVKQLGLLVTDAVGGVNNKRTYSNWADARFIMAGNHVPEMLSNSDERYLLTPAPDNQPKINSAAVFGVRPNHPFLYRIAATGKRPILFSADSLPLGLRVDAGSGVISGKIHQAGTYSVRLKGTNSYGEGEKELQITVGEAIALTPPMGWNGWNSWAFDIDEEKVLASASAMVHSGLSNYGWDYINIDDTWQGIRGGPFHAVQPNKKFPNFQALVDSIHAMGLKVGIYSTPYISSYAGYLGASSNYKEGGETRDSIMADHQAYKKIGEFRFETNEANQMAAWGIDYLKYDWRVDLESAERMAAALRNSGRDIVFSLSNSAPFAQAEDWARVANLYRTGPDIRDSWLSLYVLAFGIDKWGPYGGPGHWNDPDMLVLGNVATGTAIHPSRLTPDEQYSHISIFSLLAAPLLIGCPLEQLDDFTLNLLSNDEVIEINQDPLGKPAKLLLEENGVQVWVKPMKDGSYAVGLFNLAGYGETPQSFFRWGDELPTSFTFNFDQVGLKGKWKLRDVWRQQNLGDFEGIFKTPIPYHGVKLLRMHPDGEKI